MRTVVLGSRASELTSIVVERLIDNDIDIAAVLVHGAGRSDVPAAADRLIRVEQRTAIETVAAQRGVEILEAGEPFDPQDASPVRALSPDVVLIACFAEILTSVWLETPRHGCFNLHPSCLPSYRGPVPLFWQFRAGERRMAITLHRATQDVDAGPIVAQHAIDVRAGAAASEVNAQLARAGADLTVAAWRKLSLGPLPARIQPRAKATYFGRPSEADFRVSTEWSAERAFRFMRGTQAWGRPYVLERDGPDITIERALDYSPQGGPGSDEEQSAREMVIAFSPGTVRVVKAKE